MNIDNMVRDKIYQYLIDGGCDKVAAMKAADKGVEFFNQCNHKDPYTDSLCHAGVVWAEHLDLKYKFKKPRKAVGKAFSQGKPRPRKHTKQQLDMF